MTPHARARWPLGPRHLPLIIASDLHWDSREMIFTARERAATLALLAEVARQYGARTLLLLGDTFIMQEDDAEFKRACLRQLEALPVSELWLLPGNHDRDVADVVPRGGKTRVVSDRALDLVWHGRSVITCTHDAGGGYYAPLNPPAAFLQEMRALLAVPPATWLVTGHVHEYSFSRETRATSLSPFSTRAGAIAPGAGAVPARWIRLALSPAGTIAGRVHRASSTGIGAGFTCEADFTCSP